MKKKLSDTARKALTATDWDRLDAMTDEDIAHQIASNPDAAPDMGGITVTVYSIEHSLTYES